MLSRRSISMPWQGGTSTSKASICSTVDSFSYTVPKSGKRNVKPAMESLRCPRTCALSVYGILTPMNSHPVYHLTRWVGANWTFNKVERRAMHGTQSRFKECSEDGGGRKVDQDDETQQHRRMKI